MSSKPQSLEEVEADVKVMDATKHEHLEVASTGITWTADEEKKLLRKIDLYLLPIMWLMYLLSYMDRTKLDGLNEM